MSVPRAGFEAAIAVTGLTKRFGDVAAVHGLSFSVAPGEIFGLLGPNGAGKTTTIQLLLGLTTPTAGDVKVLGLSMPSDRLAILQRVNFSSAYISLPSNLTVRQNLRVFAGLYGCAGLRRRSMRSWSSSRFRIPRRGRPARSLRAS